MPVPQLVLRIPKGSPLTPGELDNNFTLLVGWGNGLETQVGVSVNADGSLKASVIGSAQIAANAIIAGKIAAAALGVGVNLDGGGLVQAKVDGQTIITDVSGNIAIKPGSIPGSAKQVLLLDSKASGTAPGAFPANFDFTRAFTTLAVNEIGNAVVLTASANPNTGGPAGHKITLPAGTYDCDIIAPALQVNQHKAWLHNVTDNQILLTGTSAQNGVGGNYAVSESYIRGRFVLAAQKDVEVRQRCLTAGNLGLAFNSNGMTEVYTIARFMQLAQ